MWEKEAVSELVRRKGLCEGLELAGKNVIYEVLKFRESCTGHQDLMGKQQNNISFIIFEVK